MSSTASINRFLLLLLLPLLLARPATAEQAYDDASALQGLSQGKGVFLLDFTSPKKTAFYLDIIKGTHARLHDQEVEPDFVVVFIGKTVEYLTTKPRDEIDMEYGDQLSQIAATARSLKELGVRMEVCAVATDAFDIDNDTVLPSMHVVGDGFISLIGWQSQGYHLVPVF